MDAVFGLVFLMSRTVNKLLQESMQVAYWVVRTLDRKGPNHAQNQYRETFTCCGDQLREEGCTEIFRILDQRNSRYDTLREYE